MTTPPNLAPTIAPVLAVAIAVVLGCLFPIQSAVNIRLGKVAGSPLWGTVANFTVGLAGILALLVARREAPPRLADLAASPWWSWTGGLMGVSIVCGAIMLTPAIGTLLFSVGTLAGQLVASVVIDHYGLFGLPHHGASLGRIGGLALVALGIVLIRVY